MITHLSFLSPVPVTTSKYHNPYFSTIVPYAHSHRHDVRTERRRTSFVRNGYFSEQTATLVPLPYESRDRIVDLCLLNKIKIKDRIAWCVSISIRRCIYVTWYTLEKKPGSPPSFPRIKKRERERNERNKRESGRDKEKHGDGKGVRDTR